MKVNSEHWEKLWSRPVSEKSRISKNSRWLMLNCFNALLGRWMHKNIVVPFTYHQCIKYLLQVEIKAAYRLTTTCSRWLKLTMRTKGYTKVSRRWNVAKNHHLQGKLPLKLEFVWIDYTKTIIWLECTTIETYHHFKVSEACKYH